MSRKSMLFVLILIPGLGLWARPGEPVQTKDAPVLKETLRLDLGREYDGAAIASIGDLAVGADGGIYILDNRGGRILRFDSEGKFLGTFGRPGQGPGELQRPMSLVRSASGDIVVSDGNFSVFSGDGVFLKRIAGRPNSLVDAIFPAKGGGFLLSETRFRSTDAGIALDKTVEHTDADFRIVKTLFRRSDEYGGKAKTTATAYYSFAAGPGSELFVLDRTSREYRVLALAPEGRPISDIVRPYRPVAKCPEDLADEKHRLRAAGARIAAMEGGSGSDVEVNPEKFAVDNIAVDRQGRLWAATHAPEPCDRTIFVDVFGIDRSWIGRFRLGAFAMPRLKIGGDALYVFDNQPTEEIVLVRYDLKGIFGSR